MSSPVEVAGDEVGGEGVAVADEVGAGGVEGVGEGGGFADECPAVGGVGLFDAVGEVLDAEEVFDVVAAGFDRGGELGFVAAHPVEPAVEF